MKIPANNTENFLKAPDKKIISALFYGPDLGLISENAKKLSLSIGSDLSDPFRVVDLSYERILEDASILADEINAISMLGGRRLIRIVADSSSVSDDIIDILENSKSDTFVIFTAGDLATTSSLRKKFETMINGAVIPCYKDEDNTIQRVIAEMLRKEGFNYDHEIIPYISQKFSGDRLIILQEVNKLMTYMGENKIIALKDVQDSIQDTSEFSLDDLCSALASRKIQETDKNINKALSEGVVPVVIIRSVLRYFMRMHEVKSKMINGMPEQTAISALRPPVFFKQLPPFKRHLAEWKITQINTVIKKLNELEIQCKTTGNPAELLCARLVTLLPVYVRK